jgi:hypothetical protein
MRNTVTVNPQGVHQIGSIPNYGALGSRYRNLKPVKFDSGLP